MDKKIPVGIDFLELNEAYPYVAQIFQRDVCRFEPIISNVLKDFSITLCNDETKTKVENAKLENRNFVFTIKKYPSLLKLRDLPSSQIGSLVALRGQVTRTTEIHPELIFGAFQCQECFHKQTVVQQYRYTTPTACANNTCNNRKNWQLILGESIFADWQKVKVQESPSS